jgi:hypothetical protein
MTSQTIGSRRQVWNGTAKKTSGGLTKSDLIMSHGHIVSKSKHFSAKKEMRLLKHGYGTKKGKFGFVKVGTKRHNKGRKMRGGHVNIGHSLSPNGIDGQGITDYSNYGSVGVQEAAGMAGGRSRTRGMAGGRRRSRRMAGGYDGESDELSSTYETSLSDEMNQTDEEQGGGSYGSANWNSDKLTGGKRRRRRNRKMRGGTTSQRFNYSPSKYDSTDVQFRAGLGN